MRFLQPENVMSEQTMLMYPDEYRVMFEIEDDYWWYRGLRELIRALLAQYAPESSSRPMILDVGCGTGANLKLLQSYGNAIGIDISEQALGFCRARGIPENRMFFASAVDLPFPAGQFDLIVSFEVLCNLQDDSAAFHEIARVLKPGAPFIVGLPAYEWLWSDHDVAVGHKRRYDARALSEKLSAAGFQIERLTYANALLFPLIAAVRLLGRRPKAKQEPAHSDLVPLPRLINAVLTAVFVAEMRAVSRVNLPFGVTLIAVARKL
jgi:SAM-dependent methyltransferase